MSDPRTTATVLPALRSNWGRKPRIAVSVFFALLAVATIVLWIASYWRMDTINIPDANGVMSLTSFRGRLLIEPVAKTFGLIQPKWRTLRYREGELHPGFVESYELLHPSAGRRIYGPLITMYAVPYWLIAAVSGLVATLAGVRLSARFSLRTLLIATTLIAVVLGLAVWAAGA